jgi:hypothetical protein
MAAPKNTLPECGLYRTTKPLPGNENECPAGLLVYFHNHSDSGLPEVIVPDHNIHNRWHFHGPGIQFRAPSWAESLTKMPNQGFYSLRKELAFDGGSWPKGALVQLGYTRIGEPILFIAQQRGQMAENDLFFAESGVKVGNDKLAQLEPLTVFIEQGGHAAADNGLETSRGALTPGPSPQMGEGS